MVLYDVGRPVGSQLSGNICECVICWKREDGGWIDYLPKLQERYLHPPPNGIYLTLVGTFVRLWFLSRDKRRTTHSACCYSSGTCIHISGARLMDRNPCLKTSVHVPGTAHLGGGT